MLDNSNQHVFDVSDSEASGTGPDCNTGRGGDASRTTPAMHSDQGQDTVEARGVE